MKFSTTTLSLLSLSSPLLITAQVLQPIFTCPSPEIGGCCERFLPDGDGVGCVEADILIEGSTYNYTCNDSPSDPGLPACCTIIPNSGPGGIPLPCVEVSF